MRRSWSLVLLPVLVLLGGCGDGADLRKTTYPRTTIPASAPPRLSADGLRLLDPCGLLDTAVLARFGTPDANRGYDYDDCRNYMKDGNGRSLNFTVRTGARTTRLTREKATEQVAGFKAATSAIEGACFFTLLLEDPEPDLAVELQVGYPAGDACQPGREVAESVGRRLWTAPLRKPDNGSLLGLDPCAVVADLPAQVLPGAIRPEPDGVHQCSWRVDGAELELQFALRPDPGRQPTGVEPFDLGSGTTAHQRARSDVFPVCELDWLHRKITDDSGDAVSIEVRDVLKKGIDVCGTAVAFAKGLLAKLPKP